MFPLVCSNGSTRTVPLLAPVGHSDRCPPAGRLFTRSRLAVQAAWPGRDSSGGFLQEALSSDSALTKSSICSSSFRSSRSPGATTRATAVLGLIDAYTSATVLCCPTCGASLPGDRSAHHPGSGCLRAVQSAGVTSPVAVFVAGSSPLGALP